MRAICRVLVLATAVCGIAAPSGAQSAENLAFEVASIKQSVFPGDSRYFAGFATGAGCTPAVMTISGTRVRLRWAGLCNLIAQAYDLRDYAISGDQKWIKKPAPSAYYDADRSAYYDIEARVPDDSVPLTTERVRVMLKTLLAERFQLKVHRELKQVPVYALVIGKNGPNLHLSPQGPCALHPKIAIIWMTSCTPDTSMAQLAERLSRYTDRPVIDKTGIEGGQVFELNWSGGLQGPATQDLLASLFTAVQEQGLRLEPTRAAVELLVTDSVQRPTEN